MCIRSWRMRCGPSNASPNVCSVMCAPRREVDAATLDAVIGAMLGFALEGGLVK